jgi:hypothetical protein
VTYYESCVCANGYDKVCGEGEVGVGNYCELEGVKYYKECARPEDNQCTAGHVTACDTNQESYSPCVDKDENGKQVVKYLCKCPSNWKNCEGGTGEVGIVDTCYSACTFSGSGNNYSITASLIHNYASRNTERDAGYCFDYVFDNDVDGNATYYFGSNVFAKDKVESKKTSNEMKLANTFTAKGFSTSYWNLGADYPTLKTEK